MLPWKVKDVTTKCLGPLSRERLEIRPRLQQSTYRKWHMGHQMVTWPMTSHDPKRSRSWPKIFQKRLEIETWYQWSTNRKGHMGNRLVMWTLTSRELEWSRCDPKMFGGHYLENGWRYSFGYIRAPIGNGICGIKWSHHWWRNVTLKGQGHDPDIFRCKYLENA